MWVQRPHMCLCEKQWPQSSQFLTSDTSHQRTTHFHNMNTVNGQTRTLCGEGFHQLQTRTKQEREVAAVVLHEQLEARLMRCIKGCLVSLVWLFIHIIFIHPESCLCINSRQNTHLSLIWTTSRFVAQLSHCQKSQHTRGLTYLRCTCGPKDDC